MDAVYAIYEPILDSQAGRRGFDPRLPLHVFKHLEIFEVLHLTAITALSRFEFSPITSRSREGGCSSILPPT
jgi:hypothetical protein